MIDEKEWLLMQQETLAAERRMLDQIENLNQRLLLEGSRLDSLQVRANLLETAVKMLVAGEKTRP